LLYYSRHISGVTLINFFFVGGGGGFYYYDIFISKKHEI
jgi:hypothetical protein